MKEGITFEEHEIIGMICKILNVKLLNTIPKYRTKVETRRCHHVKANDFLARFKDHMEEIMFKDFPKESTSSIYYGERKEMNIFDWIIKKHSLIRTCNDCHKLKLPLGKSMYDGKWRCPMCDRKFNRR